VSIGRLWNILSLYAILFIVICIPLFAVAVFAVWIIFYVDRIVLAVFLSKTAFDRTPTFAIWVIETRFFRFAGREIAAASARGK
jgi:hypothetical protein